MATLNLQYADIEQTFVNKGYILRFTHIPTSKSTWFKAILTQFADKYESSWSSEDVYGRMDPIENFQNTKRRISLGWDIRAADENEAKENLQKVSLLIAMLYPVYTGGDQTSAGTMSTAPLLRLSFANLIQNASVGNGQALGLVGRVSGFTNEPVIDEGFFDVSAGILYPKAMRFACDFTVYHMHPLGWDEDKNARGSFSKFPYGETISATSNPRKTTGGGGTVQQKKALQNQVLGILNTYTQTLAALLKAGKKK